MRNPSNKKQDLYALLMLMLNQHNKLFLQLPLKIKYLLQKKFPKRQDNTQSRKSTKKTWIHIKKNKSFGCQDSFITWQLICRQVYIHTPSILKLERNSPMKTQKHMDTPEVAAQRNQSTAKSKFKLKYLKDERG